MTLIHLGILSLFRIVILILGEVRSGQSKNSESRAIGRKEFLTSCLTYCRSLGLVRLFDRRQDVRNSELNALGDETILI